MNNGNPSQKREPHTVIKQFTAIRKMKNMTVQEVSTLTGVSISSINKMEAGWRMPSLTQLLKLVHAVGAEINLVGW